ncbi:hypothetical protein ARMGADRAFT_1015416 [Armillaria gallica]|uniref:Uncharacterized protein n=1 Tax=Armillaria gallica TaxID=47427 RepID=A0A2H3D1S5_ARMGA|nr:hypothetical protein ARMGADRAFT_1015416 [Armillaria gallica]
MAPTKPVSASSDSLGIDFPLRNSSHKPGETIHFHICGFAMTGDDLPRWADRYDTERDGRWFKRLDATRTENLHELPRKIKGHMHIYLSDIGRKSIHGSPRRCEMSQWYRPCQFNRPVDFHSARLWGR